MLSSIQALLAVLISLPRNYKMLSKRRSRKAESQEQGGSGWIMSQFIRRIAAGLLAMLLNKNAYLCFLAVYRRESWWKIPCVVICGSIIQISLASTYTYTKWLVCQVLIVTRSHGQKRSRNGNIKYISNLRLLLRVCQSFPRVCFGLKALLIVDPARQRASKASLSHNNCECFR